MRETTRESDSQTERQAYKERKTDRHRNSESEIGHTERQTESHHESKTERNGESQINRLKDRQKHLEREGEGDRE